MPLISAPELTRFTEEILVAAGVPPHKAPSPPLPWWPPTCAAWIRTASNLVPFYVEKLLAGQMDPQTDGRVISESGACLLFDGQNGVGQWIAETCCGHAVRIAGKQGMALVVARQSNHFGAAAWWARKMRAAGQIGIVFCNASSYRAAVAGQAGPGGHQPHLDVGAGALAAGYGRPPRWAGRVFKAFLQRAAGDSGGLGVRLRRRAHHRHAEGVSGECSCQLGGYKAVAWA